MDHNEWLLRFGNYFVAVNERSKVCRNQVIVYFEPSIENLEDFVDVHVQLAIMRNTQTGIELFSLYRKYF